MLCGAVQSLIPPTLSVKQIMFFEFVTETACFPLASLTRSLALSASLSSAPAYHFHPTAYIQNVSFYLVYCGVHPLRTTIISLLCQDLLQQWLR